MEKARMIDAETKLYGIIGNPVRHSLSPVIHNGAFKRMGWNAVYLAFEVHDLGKALTGIKALGIRGVSVTVPFKDEVISYLDRIDPTAEKIKAVNTIANEGGKLIGYNTDWLGALEALEEKIDLKGRKVVLLGAGGAARAIGFGLKERGCELVISNRTMDQGKRLAEELASVYLPISSFIGTNAEGLEGEVVINATSVGMSPHDTESPVPKNILRKGMTVMDIVYSPLRTTLLREAEEQGCQTIDGLEMLVRQAEAQLEIWTGKKPGIREIKEDLRKVLEIRAFK